MFNVAIEKVQSKLAQISQSVGSAIDNDPDVDLVQLADNTAQDPNNLVDDSELNNVINEVTQEVSKLETVEQVVEDSAQDEDATGATGATGGSAGTN
ncbi:hypothetical protein CF392_15980 [Tamilnaduibacter salinus]|uniref:Uncharacterized protein n=1 Tax=Tamilnaduibacter salinus TaxID=1484056 RepID=A0A2A2HZQ6_9GAMM|nr:hypothetical protein [Tamilnaduibacter salinus]PAV24494.1 hypothetical protein CF392_15980 [Tamilnaduibacter salinus]